MDEELALNVLSRVIALERLMSLILPGILRPGFDVGAWVKEAKEGFAETVPDDQLRELARKELDGWGAVMRAVPHVRRGS